jgi:antitoxin component of MazEF toxin-antitoxin module
MYLLTKQIRLVINMPSKSEHKIMRHGTSGVVVIPKPFRDYHRLVPGNIVTVLYDSLILIVPKDRENLIMEKAELIDQLLGQPKKNDHEHIESFSKSPNQ